MPQSTTPAPDKRRQKLIDECVQQATLVGRFGGDPDARQKGAAAYRARLAQISLPQLERERGQLELENRRRFTATSASLLRSSGPKVVTKYLPRAGLVVLLQRVDLLDLAVNGVTIPEPLTSRVLEMVDAEGVPARMLEPREYSETIQALRVIACTTCIIPPPEYFEDPAFDVDRVDPRECAPQFVMPGAPCLDGQLPIYVPENAPRDDGWRGLKRADLKEIAQAVVEHGPGAMIAFRLRQERLVEDVHEGGGDELPPKRAARDRVRVAGARPRQRRQPVRELGEDRDGEG